MDWLTCPSPCSTRDVGVGPRVEMFLATNWSDFHDSDLAHQPWISYHPELTRLVTAGPRYPKRSPCPSNVGTWAGPFLHWEHHVGIAFGTVVCYNLSAVQPEPRYRWYQHWDH